MDKITLTLTKSEWQQLAALVLRESATAEKIEDKYMRALIYPLLKQVYVKLHNKLHSLKAGRNPLYLTLPESSVLAKELLKNYEYNYVTTLVIGIIDQKLT